MSFNTVLCLFFSLIIIWKKMISKVTHNKTNLRGGIFEDMTQVFHYKPFLSTN